MVPMMTVGGAWFLFFSLSQFRPQCGFVPFPNCLEFFFFFEHLSQPPGSPCLGVRPSVFQMFNFLPSSAFLFFLRFAFPPPPPKSLCIPLAPVSGFLLVFFYVITPVASARLLFSVLEHPAPPTTTLPPFLLFCFRPQLTLSVLIACPDVVFLFFQLTHFVTLDP